MEKVNEFKVGHFYHNAICLGDHKCKAVGDQVVILEDPTGKECSFYRTSSWFEVRPKVKKKYYLAHLLGGGTCKYTDDPRDEKLKVVYDRGTWYPITGTIIALTEHEVEFEEGEGLGA